MEHGEIELAADSLQQAAADWGPGKVDLELRVRC
jgi:hypothetical protein